MASQPWEEVDAQTSERIALARAGGSKVLEMPGSKRVEKDAKDEPLPLPGWLVKLYFIFPIILYVPDVIFNYNVYSDGATIPQTDNMFLLVSEVALWSFLSVGVVGMAYLLSVLAPWHWLHNHKMQAFFCGVGVLIATAITTWNSLAYRSLGFSEFPTDKWAYSIWPQLQANNISITMILVAIAPPFWGLFWALTQPTQNKRSMAHLQESHAERMMRLQQEAEIKRLKAETNAKIREAQLKGMAQTAAAAREQAGNVAASWGRKKDEQPAQPVAKQPVALASSPVAPARAQSSGQSLMRTPSGRMEPATAWPVVNDSATSSQQPREMFASPVRALPTPPPTTRGRGKKGDVQQQVAPVRGRTSAYTSPRGTEPSVAMGDAPTGPVRGRGDLDHVEDPGSRLPVNAVERGR